MANQIIKTRFSYWGGLLVLLILALGVYLDHQRPVIVDPFSQHQLLSLRQNLVPEPRAKLREQSQMKALAHDTADLDGNQVPNVLTPEEARRAVFGKENAVYEKATQLFEAEAIDVEWANSYEKSLRSMFAGHSGLMRVSVNTINCRTSMCRIEVFTPRDADADYFTAMFYNALDNFHEGALKAEASIARRMEQGVTSVYIARKGYTLGFY